MTEDGMHAERIILTQENKQAAVAAVVILIGFGVVAFFLPRLMVALGEVSTVAAGALAVVFVACFFGIFWLRARSQRRKGR